MIFRPSYVPKSFLAEHYLNSFLVETLIAVAHSLKLIDGVHFKIPKKLQLYIYIIVDVPKRLNN